MSKAALERYQARMQRVLDHIDQHLESELGLAALSGIAAFSMHHFTGSSRRPSGCPCIAMFSSPA